MLNYTNLSAGTKSVDKISGPDVIVIVNCAINIQLMLIAIVGNALVLAAIWRTPSLRRSPSTIFLSSLAVSDLLVGSMVQPLFVASGLAQDDFLGRLWLKVGFVSCGVSLSTMAVISLDRFLALHYHVKYAEFMTRSRVISILITIWLFNFLLPCVYIWNPTTYYQFAAGAICVYLLISTFSYIGIYRIVHHHQTHIFAQHQAAQLADGNTLNMMRLKRNAVNTFVFYIFMILCYMPVFVGMTISLTIGARRENSRGFGTTAVFMNSAINPILYSWRLVELRAAVVKTVRNLVCKRP